MLASLSALHLLVPQATACIAALSLLLGACSPGEQVHEARGILLDVQSTDLLQAETIALRAEGGSIQAFRVSPEVTRDPQHPNTASHLRQHMTVADRVVVRYRDGPDGPIAVQVVDEASLR